jgi:excisionase family DNA binding protein
MKHYAVNQVAEYFKVSKSTVQRWIRDGHLPNARKRGPARNSPYTVPESDVKSLEEQLRRPQEKALVGPPRRQARAGPRRTLTSKALGAETQT